MLDYWVTIFVSGAKQVFLVAARNITDAEQRAVEHCADKRWFGVRITAIVQAEGWTTI